MVYNNLNVHVWGEIMQEMDHQEFDEIPEKTSREDRKQRKTLRENILLYLHDFVTLLAAVLLVFLLLFRVVVVFGPSMNDTLVQGDYLLLLSSTFYTDPQQGDIIVASKSSFEDGEPIIKRVIATEGQWVNIDFNSGIVYVNDQPLDEVYVKTPTNLQADMTFPLLVDEGCVFAMGDNRNRSKDSRFTEIGLIDHREIIGKAIFLFYPGIDENKNQDFGRIGAVS